MSHRRVNPHVGVEQPDLFGGMTRVFVALEDLTEDQIKSLPRDRFTQDEFDSLDDDLQEYIHEHDPASGERINALVKEFVDRHKWAEEPSEDWVRERTEEDFDYAFESWGDELVERARQYDHNSVESIEDHYQGLGYLGSDVHAALLEALQDRNNYSYSYNTDQYGNAFIKASSTESFYIERNDLDELLKGMYPDEVRVALKEINRETYLNLDEDDLQRKYGIEIDDYATFYADADPDWEKIEEALKEALGDEPIGEPPRPELPPEERVVHRYKDGSYVLDLLPSELPAEGKAMGMCVGRSDMGYTSAVKRGHTKILSLRTPSGRSKFTIEVHPDRIEPERPPEIAQIKGKANRLPGYDLGKAGQGPPKEDEVAKLLELVADVLRVDPEDVPDLKPALRAMKELPPGPKKNPRGYSSTTCPQCGSILEGERDFCTPASA